MRSTKPLFVFTYCRVGNGVEKFICDENEWAGSNIRKLLVPFDRMPVRVKRCLLNFRQPLADLHHMDFGGGDEIRSKLARRTDEVFHERAASRTHFAKNESIWSAECLPCVDAPHANEFSKHLADFGGSDEIAVLAEGFARRVIASIAVEEAHRHILSNADRACCLDLAYYALLQVHRPVATSGLRADITKPSPKSTMGIERTIPIVSQPP